MLVRQELLATSQTTIDSHPSPIVKVFKSELPSKMFAFALIIMFMLLNNSLEHSQTSETSDRKQNTY